MQTVIEIRPVEKGWKVFEAPGVEPVFPKSGAGRTRAIGYAQHRGQYYSRCEIREVNEARETVAKFDTDAPNISGLRLSDPLGL